MVTSSRARCCCLQLLGHALAQHSAECPARTETFESFRVPVIHLSFSICSLMDFQMITKISLSQAKVIADFRITKSLMENLGY